MHWDTRWDMILPCVGTCARTWQFLARASASVVVLDTTFTNFSLQAACMLAISPDEAPLPLAKCLPGRLFSGHSTPADALGSGCLVEVATGWQPAPQYLDWDDVQQSLSRVQPYLRKQSIWINQLDPD